MYARVIQESGYDNATVRLTGAKAVTLSELAAKISAILNRTITLKVVGLEEFVEYHKHKQTEELLRTWSTTWTAIGRGETGVVDPLLTELLGREPKSIDETLKEVLGEGGDRAAADLKRYGRTSA